jgi:phage baseplate assembly protein W
MALPTVAERYSLQRPENDILYSDFLTDLNFHPQTNALLSIVNEASVARSIRNLLLTNKYERLFNPNIGSNIRSILFENVSGHSTAALKTAITETIENYEPRAKLVSVNVTAYPDRNGYVTTITFYILNESESVTINVPLYRVR